MENTKFQKKNSKMTCYDVFLTCGVSLFISSSFYLLFFFVTDGNTWVAMKENIFWICVSLFCTLWIIFIYMSCKSYSKNNNLEYEVIMDSI